MPTLIRMTVPWTCFAHCWAAPARRRTTEMNMGTARLPGSRWFRPMAPALGVMLFAAGSAPVLLAQSGGEDSGNSRIWSGVYTAAQAERGKENYVTSCSNCHNLDLNGSVRAPTLRG